MKTPATLVAVASLLAAAQPGHAQTTANDPMSAAPVVLLDATGNVAARALTDTMMLISAGADVVAPAVIQPVYDADGRAVSGIATWAGGGSALFSAPECTGAAYVHASSYAGVRAASQVETHAGTLLYVGAIGSAETVTVRSILYGNGCAAVTIRQSGLVPVVTTINLTKTYPPPLTLQ